MKNIYEKLFTIMQEMKDFESSKMEFGKTKYNYLSELEVTSKLRELMIREKVLLMPTEVVENTILARDNPLTNVVVTYNFINVEDPEEALVVCGAGQGYDSADKSLPKAMTAAFKVMQRQTFAIPSPSKDDPDTTASDSYHNNTLPFKKPDTSSQNQNSDNTPAEDAVIPFGTHKGKTLKELMANKTGRSYIDWLANKSETTGPIKQAAQTMWQRIQQEDQQ